MKTYFNLQHCKYLHNSKRALLDFESLKKVWKVLIYVKRVYFEMKRIFFKWKGFIFKFEKMKRFFWNKKRMKRFFKWKGFWVFLKSINEMKMKRKGFWATPQSFRIIFLCSISKVFWYLNISSLFLTLIRWICQELQ